MKLEQLKQKVTLPKTAKFMPFLKSIFKQKWLKRLDRYIIVKFLGTYFFAIALIISISVVFDINENIDRFINNKAPLEAIVFDYYLNFIPYYTNLFRSVVRLYCGDILYLKACGEFRNHRDVLYRHEL